MIILVICLIAVVAIRLLFRLPPLTERSPTAAYTDTATTQLGKVVAAKAAIFPSKSGVYSLSDGEAAFAARALLAGIAARSIDAQYYIWRQDLSGRLLTVALVEAADRGVRVRLLLDDNGTKGQDALLAALDAHPNIEVRLFNPFVVRSPRLIGYLTDFFRLNRRMHNKSFTVDNQATIIGGRNVGDEYFAAAEDVQFADLDVLATGPVTSEVSNQFDLYWACASSYPACLILPPPPPNMLQQLMDSVDADAVTERGKDYASLLGSHDFMTEFLSGELQFEWTDVKLVYDDPAKGLGKIPRRKLLLSGLIAILGKTESRLDLVSPYFVPGRSGASYLSGLSRSGKTVRVLTNSLEANDVQPVHAGYERYRKKLLKADIKIFEMKSLKRDKARRKWPRKLGASSASLHAKVFAIDGKRIFVGSFNFDPRSALLNCEMGLVIDSPALAGGMSSMFDGPLDAVSYQPRLDSNGKLYWVESGAGQEFRHDTEPNTSVSGRLAIRAIALLPIEWLL
jgi:cardiolipin synthase C